MTSRLLVVVCLTAACRFSPGATGIDGAGDDATDGMFDAEIDAPSNGFVGGHTHYLKASNTQGNDRFADYGFAMSRDGTTLAVAADLEDSNATGINGNQTDNSAGDSGAVYVYVRSGATWVQEAYLKASNTDNGDQFGFGVALSTDGNTLVVGAPLEDCATTGINGAQTDNAAPDSGAVYVFARTAGTWSQIAYLKASNTDAGDNFGFAVAISGDGSTVVSGAFAESSSARGVNGNASDNAAFQAGAAYVFRHQPAGAWIQQAYLKASNPDVGDFFGGRLAISKDGDTVAVRARHEDSNATGINGDQADNTAADSGAVYVFTRASAGMWSQQAYIKASNTGALDEFGGSGIALSGTGNVLAVGAPLEDSNGSQLDNSIGDSGAAYVFSRSGTTWMQDAYLKASNPGFSDFFGYGLSLSGDGLTLAVGAFGEDSAATGQDGDQLDENALNAGAVYVFHRTGMTWAQRAYVKAPNTGSGDAFGVQTALSVDGMTLLVGAPNEDSAATGVDGDLNSNSSPDSGAIYVFD